MSMRDKIASTISKNITLEDGVFVGGFFDAADAIIDILPDYDAQQARIKELEDALGHCIYEIERDGSRKSSMVRRAAFARTALKGEKT
jgi:hypothetical protein